MKNFLCVLIATVILSLTSVFLVGCETDKDSDKQQTPSLEQNDDIVFVASKEEVVLKENGFYCIDYSVTVNGVRIGSPEIEYFSENSEIATISSFGSSSGRIKAISEGETSVTAKYKTKTATTKVIVEKEKFATDVSLNENFIGIIVGGTKKLTALAKKNGKTDESAALIWNSSDNKVATVSDGVVKAISRGEAVISVEYEGVSDSVTVYVAEETAAQNVNSFDEQYINIFGRSYTENRNLKLHHASNSVEVGFIGSSLTVNLQTTATSYMRVYIDGKEFQDRIKITYGVNKYVVASGLSEGYHLARVVKATEMQNAVWALSSFEADKFATVPEKPDLKIEFIGDSITAGYGSLGPKGANWSVDNSDSTRTYAYYTAQNLKADYSVVAWSGICAKAYQWADRNMLSLYPQLYADGKNYEFNFNPDVVVLNLGTNDSTYLSEHSEYEAQFSADYKELLLSIRRKNPDAYIICLYGMMGMDTRIDNGIKSAINAINDDCIAYNPFTIIKDGNGAAGHPSATAQSGWAKQLAEYIESAISGRAE